MLLTCYQADTHNAHSPKRMQSKNYLIPTPRTWPTVISPTTRKCCQRQRAYCLIKSILSHRLVCYVSGSSYIVKGTCLCSQKSRSFSYMNMNYCMLEAKESTDAFFNMALKNKLGLFPIFSKSRNILSMTIRDVLKGHFTTCWPVDTRPE